MGSDTRVSGFRGLKVWQMAMEMAADVYRLTARFPKHELYGLSSQLRRAAVSVPSNSAEGNKRESTKEYLHHVSIAAGSLAELETQLLLALKFEYSDPTATDPLLLRAAELGRMLVGLPRSLRAKL
jgi:four helix bundle protein